MSVQRTLFAADKTGFHLLHTLFQTSLKYSQISRYDEWFVTSIAVQDDRVAGVTALDVRTGALHLITAKAIVLATGGGGQVFAFTTNGAICTGDGMALAYRAGVPLKDMEFVQFHPTGLPGTGILITEACRGEGGLLLNARGERFLERYTPSRMEMGPRDIISRAIMTELEEGKGFGGPRDGYVHLDLRHLGRKLLEERLPFVLELAQTYLGIDPLREPIPVRPVVHYMMGGVHTDAHGRTPLQGLFACGEVACVSINGANRLGSNSLSECLVFGTRAGIAAAEYAMDQAPVKSDLSRLGEQEARRIEERFLRTDGSNEQVWPLRRELQRAMEEAAGVFRTGEALHHAIEKVKGLRERSQRVRIEDTTRTFNVALVAALELDLMLDVAEAIVHSAYARTESRGAHVRLDFPQRDDEEFLKHTLAFHTKDGPRIDDSPVTITKWQPQERKY